LGISSEKTGELHRQSMETLSIAVVAVVNVESPVHESEVIRRIRTLWGLSKTGERIQKAIESGIKYAIKNGLVRRKNGFLFKPEVQTITPRHREEDTPPNIDNICEEEIIEGILLVLKNQFSTVLPELIIQTCRVFGIHATTEYSAKRIEKIINKLLEDGQLEKLPNEMLKIKSNA
jgi:hypothetical protein